MKNIKVKIGAALFLIAIIFLVSFLIYSQEKSKSLDYAKNFQEAKFYEKLDNGMVRCNLCPNRCILSPGQIGNCRARKNIDGKLVSLVYGNVASNHIDPIEKKPLFHFLPGSQTYSISTTGCNLRCKFCQNWQISQVFPWDIKTTKMSPKDVVNKALNSGVESIAFTYNEPTVYYEYMLDVAKLAKKNGLKTVVISAGYINEKPLKNLLPYIDAYKIDLKGFDKEFYQEMTHGKLEPVLSALKTIKESDTWLEVVNLIIPGENDSEKQLKDLVLWIKNNLGKNTPLHFLRFHPNYKIRNLAPTPIKTLKKARQIALDLGMNYVYTGNIYDKEGTTTYCPSGKPGVIRQGFSTSKNNLDSGLCPNGDKIPGVWK